MGLRMRKSIRLAKGVRVNVSKRGLSTSVKIGNTTLNTRGKVTTHLAPGVSYETNLASGRKGKRSGTESTVSPLKGASRSISQESEKKNKRVHDTVCENHMTGCTWLGERDLSVDSSESTDKTMTNVKGGLPVSATVLYLLAIPAFIGAILFFCAAWYGYSRVAIHPENVRGSAIALIVGAMCSLIVIAAIITFLVSLRKDSEARPRA
ncbi:DUF4236 domain-containing protein [Bifidobacterium leontopitheci]|uniref:DUF4236 domain-containing protein n=1 Tax=Bifidobacterium leontopitheci TaxID=2650774 RepID=A0A6I1GLL0_9BIFI|nr:DUF4236 domain-containing protein [Bifidobacterium leontopitheci]KAB7790299.1 hypothetical protein F7D09_1195 [Bifidobacterium leontopitheci]